MLMASICTMDSRLLPLLADSPSISLSVTEFMAENCMELKPPKMNSCTSSSQTGVPGTTSPNEASMRASITELTCNTRL